MVTKRFSEIFTMVGYKDMNVTRSRQQPFQATLKVRVFETVRML